MTDELLRERISRLGAGPETADWNEVRTRGLRLRRQRRIRLVGVAAVATALAVAATPAFGLGGRVIDFLQGEPASEALKLQFAELNTGAPPGMAPGVIASQTRAVMTRELYNGPYTLWVAPTRDGGFCVHFGRTGREGGSGGCQPARIMPLSPSFARANDRSPLLAYGSVLADGATQVEIELDSGRNVRTELVWVSEPIDAGFYAADIAEGYPKAVLARDDDGNELARQDLPPGAGRPPRPTPSTGG
jgi:hypothetical protein